MKKDLHVDILIHMSVLMHFVYSLKIPGRIHILLLFRSVYVSWIWEEGKEHFYTLNTLILFELFIFENIFICKGSRAKHTSQQNLLGSWSEFQDSSFICLIDTPAV